MKMYVWSKAYSVPYGSAVAVAVAESAEAARIMVKGRPRVSEFGYEPIKATMLDIDREPDWEHDIDDAIVFEWSE